MKETLNEYNLHAEKTLLGALLDEPYNLLQIDFLKSAHFYHQTHQKIYASILNLKEKKRTLDHFSLFEQMKEDGNYSTEYFNYINDIVVDLPINRNLFQLAEVITDYAHRREIVDIGVKIQTGMERPTKQILTEILTRLTKIKNQAEQETNLKTLKTILFDVAKNLDKQEKAGKELTGIDSGFHYINTMTGGLQESDLIILAARPSMGKTALALNLATNIVKSKIPVLFFSLEMSSLQLGIRYLGSDFKIDTIRLRNARKMTDADNKILYSNLKALHNADLPLFIDDSSGTTIDSITAIAHKFKKSLGFKLIIIDYIQLISSPVIRNETRETQVSKITRGLKILAKDLNIPVLALAQLNRGLESRPDKRPKLSDLRESGSLEQDSDIVMFLYRDEVYNESTKAKGVAEIIFSKNRNGSTGTIKLGFQPVYTKFVNL